MIRNRRSRSSAVEILETRRVPAAVTLAGGNLTITNPDGPLLVETTATPRQIFVSDNSGAWIVNNVTNGLVINGTNGSDVLHVDASVSPLNLNLIVNGLNGDDEVGLAGTLNRSTILNTGAGNDLVTQFGDVTVFGNLTMTDLVGVNSYLQNDFDLDVAGNLSLQGLSLYHMLNAAGGNTLAVGGSLVLTGLGPGSSSSAFTALLDGQSVDVHGKLEMYGTAANDVLVITSQFSVDSFMTVNLGLGDNTVVLTPAAGGTGVVGRTTYTGGNGADIVVFGAESNLKGPSIFNMGNGNNTLVDTPTSRFASVQVVGGNGTDTTVMTGQMTTLIVNTGDGFGDTTVLTGKTNGTFTYRSGLGDNGVLTIAPAVAQTVTLNAIFGRGTKSLNLGPNVSLTGTITGTGGTYTFNPGAATLLPSLVKRLFP